MSDVTLKIDGREVTVAKGTTILQAARELGIEIPTFCYHEGLSIAANCRMCLVETNRSPKLVPACHAQVMDGLEVSTDNDRVKEAHRAVLEFILVNHPVDCPICDQAGECDLQDRYHEHDLEASRLSIHKVHKPKVKTLGPYVVLDGERCILCTRCVRFTREVSGTDELTVQHRGDHSEITTFPGRALDNPYSMCTADLCPVGALTTTPFRFRARVWWLKSTDSVCDQCARGCSIHVDTHRNEIKRYRPRENMAVNKWWMCDFGRVSFQQEQRGAAGRLARALVRGEAGVAETTTREAADRAIERLAAARAGGLGAGVLVSPNATNEELLAAMRFAREALGLNEVFLGGRAAGTDEDALLVRNDKNANRRGAEAIAAGLGLALRDLDALQQQLGARAVRALVVQDDEHALAPALLEALGGLDLLVALASRRGPVVERAHVALPASAFFEQAGSFTNFEGQVQRLEAAVESASNTHPDWRLFDRLAAGLGLQLGYRAAEGVFADLAARVPEFGGMTLAGLGAEGRRLGSGRTIEATAAEAGSAGGGLGDE